MTSVFSWLFNLMASLYTFCISYQVTSFSIYFHFMCLVISLLVVLVRWRNKE